MNNDAATDRRRRASDSRLQELEDKIQCLEDKVDKMMVTTSSIFEIIGHARGFFAVLGLVGNVLKWFAGIVVLVGGAWAVWSGKNGG